MKILIALLVLASLVGPAAAQRRDTTGWTRSAPDPMQEVAPRRSASHRVAVRTLSGFGGTVVGIVAGATVGYQATHRHDGGEDPGLDGLVAGAVVGGAVGAAVGAALPKHGTRCTLETRLARGLLGTGAVAAAFLTTIFASDAAEVSIALPFVTPVVAAVATSC